MREREPEDLTVRSILPREQEDLVPPHRGADDPVGDCREHPPVTRVLRPNEHLPLPPVSTLREVEDPAPTGRRRKEVLDDPIVREHAAKVATVIRSADLVEPDLL